MKTYRQCSTCIEYAEQRMPLLTRHMADRCAETGETSVQILDRYMSGVHARHLSGLAILPARAA